MRSSNAGFVTMLLSALLLAGMPLVSGARVAVSVVIAPPPLPVYEQPPLPDDGYLWTPGYWAWDPDIEDYYWVPGTWVLPPEPDLLWTPGYWGWTNGFYFWHDGYWGPNVGFYGGINYGFGYTGFGYQGGYWRDRRFFYNRAVNRVTNVRVINVYNKTVINNVTVNRVSYNGGRGGLNVRPTVDQERATRERHFQRTRLQAEHERSAVRDRELHASFNRGKPPIAATERPGQFSGRGVVRAREAGGPVNTETPRPGNTRTEPSRRDPRLANPTPRVEQRNNAPIDRSPPANTPRVERSVEHRNDPRINRSRAVERPVTPATQAERRTDPRMDRQQKASPRPERQEVQQERRTEGDQGPQRHEQDSHPQGRPQKPNRRDRDRD